MKRLALDDLQAFEFGEELEGSFASPAGSLTTERRRRAITLGPGALSTVARPANTWLALRSHGGDPVAIVIQEGGHLAIDKELWHVQLNVGPSPNFSGHPDGWRPD